MKLFLLLTIYVGGLIAQESSPPPGKYLVHQNFERWTLRCEDDNFSVTFNFAKVQVELIQNA